MEKSLCGRLGICAAAATRKAAAGEFSGAGQKNQGAAESVRREDEMTMEMPFWLQIG
ncbi:MAG: hypothetical protein WCJ14_14645 [Verrucomicrobiota bacterium]